jgi:translation initiation factor IF-2
MRVYDLARQLEMSNKELIDKMHFLGIEVKSHSSSIEDSVVRTVLDHLESAEESGAPAAAKPQATPSRPAQPAPRPPEPPAPPKLDARALALQALERAKARRRQQEAEQAGAGEATLVAPEYQKVELGGGARTRPATTEPPAAPVAATPAAPSAPAPQAPQTAVAPAAAPVAPPPAASPAPIVAGPPQPAAPPQAPASAPQPPRQAPPQYAGHRPQPAPGAPATAPAARPQRPRLSSRNVELQQLPSLPKRKSQPPRGGERGADLTVPPVIDVMKLRPTRRPLVAKKPDEKEDDRRKRGGPVKQAAPIGTKKIRPGRFLNLLNLEDTVQGAAQRRAARLRAAGQSQGRGGHHAAVVREPRIFKLHGDLTVAEFAQRIGVQAAEVIGKAMGLGQMLTMNQLISADLCELLASELGLHVEIVPENDELDVAEYVQDLGKEGDLAPRPPVVTVMGHVDHGKTSLLDAIRKTNVAGGEFGGITQHIGAYHVETSRGEVVFLDTPGHAAFTAMRARGASVTDIVVLIVAADDGVMPQTVEAINHARAANAPIVVAINKVDLPDANIQRVKNELMQYSLLGEELGGDTIMCEVSAKTGQGIDALLEMIVLQAEILELKAPINERAHGVVIESEIDPLRGISATVLVQAGTLRVGDAFVCGDVSGRVRMMLDDFGHDVESALPAHPVEILGLDGCPAVGENFLVLENEKMARQIAEIREKRRRRQTQNKAQRPHVTLEGLADYLKQDDKPKDLNIVLKADVQGSVEAVSDAIQRLATEKVRVQILHSGVGAVSESDVQLAMASDAVILGFNVRPDQTANELAAQEGIDIKTYRVIYELLEELQAAMLGMLDKKFKEVTRGSAEIRQIFRISRLGNIAGCHVTTGVIGRNDKVRLVRDGKVVYEGRLSTLKRMKDDIREAAAGFECGMTLVDFQDIKEGDVIEAFTEEEVAQTL